MLKGNSHQPVVLVKLPPRIRANAFPAPGRRRDNNGSLAETGEQSS